MRKRIIYELLDLHFLFFIRTIFILLFLEGSVRTNLSYYLNKSEEHRAERLFFENIKLLYFQFDFPNWQIQV